MNKSASHTDFSSSQIPFYTCLETDRLAFLLMKEGKIDINGEITKKGEEEIDPSLYQIKPTYIEKIDNLAAENFSVMGRCPRIPMDISTSMQEIAGFVNLAALQTLGEQPEILLNGSRLLRVLMEPILHILTSWVSTNSKVNVHDVVSSIFLERIHSVANDTDWQFRLKLKSKADCISIVEKGIVEPLAVKFKEKRINPYNLVLELAKTKKHTENKPNPYLKELFERDPLPGYEDPNLHSYFIRTFAFNCAADIANESVCFSLRSIGTAGKIHDCLFPAKVRATILAFNSLFINLTALFQKKSDSLFCLESVLGPSKVNVMQAIVDSNLANFTFQSSAAADRLDFINTISKFSQGVRVYKEDWIIKTFDALLKERAKLQIPLAALLASQLISSTKDHHGGQLDMLIVLTFNTSAALLSMDNGHLKGTQKDIQKLWQFIFSYIDKQDKNFQENVNPLIEQMKILLRDPLFSFQDFYANIQIIANLLQHRTLEEKGDFECSPTQTGKHMYLQIPLRITKNSGVANHPFQYCTLFFPYDLPKAIAHFARVNDSTHRHLRHIQRIMIPSNTLIFGIDQSPLQQYNTDPRLHLPECRKGAMGLLNKKQEQAWKTGLTLSLSLLAQKYDKAFLRIVLRKQISMLLGNWADESFKEEMIHILDKTLHLYVISTNSLWLKDFNKIKAVLWLFSAKESLFIELACEYLDEIYEEENYDVNVSLYDTLLKECIGSEEQKKAQGPLLRLIERLNLPQMFLPETKLEWVKVIYGKNECKDQPEIEKSIFIVLLNSLQSMKSHSKLSHDLSFIILLAIKKSTRKDMPVQCLRLAREVERLTIFTDISSKNAFHNAIEDIQQSIGYKQDLNVKNVTEEFECSSPVEIKNYIAKRLQRYQGQEGNSCDDREAIFFLLEKLIQIESFWKVRHEIFNAIGTIAQFTSTTQIAAPLGRLFDIINGQDATSCELLDFYLKQRNANLMPLLLEQILSLLSKPKNDYSILDYQLGAEFLLEANPVKTTHQRMQKLSIPAFLQLLFERELNEEIIKIYAAIAEHQENKASKDTEILIQACAKILLSSKKLHSCNIEEQLKKLPDSVMADTSFKKELRALFMHFHDIEMGNDDLLNALPWLEKQLSSNEVLEHDFYIKGFELLRRLVACGYVQEAEFLIKNLNPPIGFGLAWLDFYKILLKEGEISLCLKLFNNEQALKSTQEEFREQWSDILEVMIHQAIELSKEDDRSNERQLNVLCKINQKLIFQNNPSKIELWQSYIHHATESAPLSTLEDLFFSLINPKSCPSILTKQLNVPYLQKIVNRLAKHGSPIFLKMKDWWPLFWIEFASETTEKQQKNLLHTLIDGTAKAIEYCTKNKEKNTSNRSMTSQQVIKGAIDFIQIYESAEMETLHKSIEFSDKVLMIPKIYLATKTLNNKIQSMLDLVKNFTALEYDPLSEELTIELFNECIESIKGCKTEKARVIAMTLIEFIQQCEHHIDANQYLILEYLQGIFPYQEEEETTKQVLKSHTGTIIISNSIFRYIAIIEKAVRGLLGNPWQRNISAKEKKLMQWALARVRNSPSLKGLELMEWAILQPNLSRYINPSSIKILDAHVQSRPLNITERMKLKYVQFRIDTRDLIKQHIMRHEVMKRCGYGDRFQLLHKEERFAKRVGVCLSVTAVVIIGVAVIIFRNIFNRTGR